MSSFNNHRVSPSTLLACIFTVSIIMLSCNPTEPYSPPSLSYHDPVDSAYKLIENLEISYISQDIWRYMQCFRVDFAFYSTSNGDSLNWGIDNEESIHTSMFWNVDMMDLTFSGFDEYPWSGDTTGSTLVLPREYGLKVYMVPDSVEYRALGTAEFICRQDSIGEWYVWQWWDYPDPGKDGWSDIKELFMTPPYYH